VHSTHAPVDPKDPAFFYMLRYIIRLAVALSRKTFDSENEKVIYRANFNTMLGTGRECFLFRLEASPSQIFHTIRQFQCSVCARREGAARHEINQGD